MKNKTNSSGVYLFQVISLIVAIISVPLLLSLPLFEFDWNQMVRDFLPNTEHFWRIVTEFGGTMVYLGIFFIVYWGIDKNKGKLLLIVYVFSNFVNYYAKAIIAKERPPESEWLLISASHLSTPSGHAMSSTVYWGYLSLIFKKWWLTPISFVLIILVGISRIYLGVHWLGDILTGWMFGIALLLIVTLATEPLKEFFSTHNIHSQQLYIGLTILGFITLILTEIFYSGSSYNFGTPGGQMMGLGLGFYLEEKYVNFQREPRRQKNRFILLRIIMGLVIILGVYLILDVFLSSSVFWQQAVLFISILVSGIFVWPWIFHRLGI